MGSVGGAHQQGAASRAYARRRLSIRLKGQDMGHPAQGNFGAVSTTYLLNGGIDVEAVAELIEPACSGRAGMCSLVVTFRDTRESWSFEDRWDALGFVHRLCDRNGWTHYALYSGPCRDGVMR